MRLRCRVGQHVRAVCSCAPVHLCRRALDGALHLLPPVAQVIQQVSPPVALWLRPAAEQVTEGGWGTRTDGLANS